jgi:hypothetical protein
MAFKFSTGFRDAVMSTGSVKAALTGGSIKVYSGTPPSTADAALSGNTLLCTITDNGGAGGLSFETASVDGTLQKLASQTWKGTNAATGTASFFRFVATGDTGASSTTQVRVQGGIGVAGNDMNLASTSLVATEEQVIDYFAIAFPTA